jgi:hypothetical protein
MLWQFVAIGQTVDIKFCFKMVKAAAETFQQMK